MAGLFPLVKFDSSDEKAVSDNYLYGALFKYELTDCDGKRICHGPYLDNLDGVVGVMVMELHETGSINIWNGRLDGFKPVCLPEYLSHHHEMTGIRTDENKVFCKDPDGNIIQCVKNADGTFFAYRQDTTEDAALKYEVDLAKCEVLVRVEMSGF